MSKVLHYFVFMTLAFLLIPAMGICDSIDVLIKGMDDGVRTRKHQDYKEAEMNAKLQAIERAGVEISSITKVVNFETKYDMVESKAKAVLLPGFQVMDMGYQTDGTYQVVLSGKVQAGAKKSALREITKDGAYILYEGGIVYDAVAQLEWVAGPDKYFIWEDAKMWVEGLHLDGGGWRMPTPDELSSLYNPGAGPRNMTPLLRTTGQAVWGDATRKIDVPKGNAKKYDYSAYLFHFADNVERQGYVFEPGSGGFAYADDNVFSVRAFAVRSRK